VTNRWIEDNGFERQRFSIGQALLLQGSRRFSCRASLTKTAKDAHSDVSPYALEYEYRFNRDWRTTIDFNWDPDSRSTRSGSAMFHYQPEDNPGRSSTPAIAIVTTRFATTRTPVNGKWAVVTTAPLGQPGYVKDYYKIQQHDFSVIWPIVPQWSAISRWQYDYNRNRTLEAFGGFEYDNCCWKLRLINRYWVL
jgi:LPS-assembly protein